MQANLTYTPETTCCFQTRWTFVFCRQQKKFEMLHLLVTLLAQRENLSFRANSTVSLGTHQEAGLNSNGQQREIQHRMYGHSFNFGNFCAILDRALIQQSQFKTFCWYGINLSVCLSTSEMQEGSAKVLYKMIFFIREAPTQHFVVVVNNDHWMLSPKILSELPGYHSAISHDYQNSQCPLPKSTLIPYSEFEIFFFPLKINFSFS